MKVETRKKFVSIYAKETLTSEELQRLTDGLNKIKGFVFALMSHSKIES